MNDKQTLRHSTRVRVAGFVKALFRRKETVTSEQKVDLGYLPSRMCPTVALDRVSTHVNRDGIGKRMR